MADEVDLLARWIAGLGLGLAGINTAILVAKERRERRAARPTVLVDYEYEAPRRLAVDVTVINPLNRGIVLTKLRLFEANKLGFLDAARGTDLRMWRPEYEDILPWSKYHEPKPNMTVERDDSAKWEGVIVIPENLASPLDTVLDLRVYIDLRDGSDRPLVRRIRKRV